MAKKVEASNFPLEEKEVNTVSGESAERIAFKQIIEKYKLQNPKKYELKKAELEAKLAKIA